jgi:hypothetical protein
MVQIHFQYCPFSKSSVLTMQLCLQGRVIQNWLGWLTRGRGVAESLHIRLCYSLFSEPTEPWIDSLWEVIDPHLSDWLKSNYWYGSLIKVVLIKSSRCFVQYASDISLNVCGLQFPLHLEALCCDENQHAAKPQSDSTAKIGYFMCLRSKTWLSTRRALVHF